MNREFLNTLLVEESFAYGFTIAFWGSGLLAIDEYGLLHTPGILAYALGTVSGFGVLAVLSFGGVFNTVEPTRTPRYVVLAGVHYLAGIVPVIVTHGLLLTSLGRTVTLFAVGVAVSVCYNVLAVVEELVSERLRALERRGERLESTK